MFVFDIFREEGRRMQVITGVVAVGMLALLAGLWYVQIVCAKQFARASKDNATRHVRTPAIRGRILDRNGLVLAGETPRYNAILYLEDLQRPFADQFARLREAYGRTHPEAVSLQGKSKGRVNLPGQVWKDLKSEARCQVVSYLTTCISTSLAEPRALNTNAFIRHFDEHPYVPFQIVPDLTPRQVATLSEEWLGRPGIDLETQPVRVYPNRSLAANLLGYVQRRNNPDAGELSFDLPDYKGTSGVEWIYDEALRGKPEDNALLINNMSYRQRQQVESPTQPGNDIYLTIDLPLQKVAEQALADAQPGARGAVVVMDPRNGDILALVSAPSFDPNNFVLGRFTPQEIEHLNDPKYTPQFNRAVTGAYPPGSTFKIITAIACLESGLDPNEVYDSPGEYRSTPTARPIADTAGKGPFDFERAFYRSSNTYFIVMGLRAGLPKILEVAKRFHLGEKTGISTRQEVAGNVPGPEKAGPSLGMSTPDICIGQEITSTPLQLAGMISVIANGGTLYVPRVVSHSRSPETGEVEELVAQGHVRDHVQIDPRHLDLIRHAMLEDTEHPPDKFGPGGSAYLAFHDNGVAILGDFHVAGKTGTAEVKSTGSPYKKITWFDSYAPYEDPRYVVVVMVEDGGSGGKACAPVACKIYKEILKREKSGWGRPPTLAQN